MWTIRLDKYLSSLWLVSRRNIKKFIKTKSILLNWEYVNKSDIKVNIWDKILFRDLKWNIYNFEVLKNFVVLLHKPAWYVSSDIDERKYFSYKKLLQDCPYKKVLKVAWRLDVDTEGLLVLSDNGNFIHKLISPKKKVEKIYYVETLEKISKSDIEIFQKWINIWDCACMPANVYNFEKLKEIFSDLETLWQIPINLLKWSDKLILWIYEWKYHQIKRMFQKLGNKVLYLKRLKVWKFELGDLKKWEWKIVKNFD